MRLLTWANNQRIPNNSVPMPLSEPLSQTINSIIMSVIAPKQNAFKFRIAPHKQKLIVNFFWQEDPPLPALGQRGHVPLSTPKHNGKSGTDSETDLYQVQTYRVKLSCDSCKVGPSPAKYLNYDFDYIAITILLANLQIYKQK